MEKPQQTQTALEIQYAGQVMECGSLEVLLKRLVSGPLPLLLIPLCRTFSRQVRQYVIHATARSASELIFFATFRVAEVQGIGGICSLTFPPLVGSDAREIRSTAISIIQKAEQLQGEYLNCLQQLAQDDPHVSEVVVPARYCLPESWIWSAHSECPAIVWTGTNWQLA